MIPDLIFDVGMHKGEDTAFYLALGYRVVAFEANPELVRLNRERFAEPLNDGRLSIISGAIADTNAESITFYTNHAVSVWGTVDEDWVRRNESITASTPVTLPTIDFADALEEHGVPHYLKIDIEGGDLVCLRCLVALDSVPKFVSIESNQSDWAGLVAEFDLLESLGYDRFAVVQQGTIPGRSVSVSTLTGERLRYRFEPDASGGFGDMVGPWVSRDAALRRYRRVFLAHRLLGWNSLLRKTKLGRGLRGQAARLSGHPLPGWHDTHASRATPSA
jgi:FkbM family methyltransferase